MKKFVFFLLSILLLLGLKACKKDYPDDIPHWLKKKVRKLDRQDKMHDDIKHSYPMFIDELSNGQETIFKFFNGVAYAYHNTIYSYDGDVQCNIAGQAPTICGEIENYDDYAFVRRIWEERR